MPTVSEWLNDNTESTTVGEWLSGKKKPAKPSARVPGAVTYDPMQLGAYAAAQKPKPKPKPVAKKEPARYASGKLMPTISAAKPRTPLQRIGTNVASLGNLAMGVASMPAEVVRQIANTISPGFLPEPETQVTKTPSGYYSVPIEQPLPGVGTPATLPGRLQQLGQTGGQFAQGMAQLAAEPLRTPPWQALEQDRLGEWLGNVALLAAPVKGLPRMAKAGKTVGLPGKAPRVSARTVKPVEPPVARQQAVGTLAEVLQQRAAQVTPAPEPVVTPVKKAAALKKGTSVPKTRPAGAIPESPQEVAAQMAQQGYSSKEIEAYLMGASKRTEAPAKKTKVKAEVSPLDAAKAEYDKASAQLKTIRESVFSRPVLEKSQSTPGTLVVDEGGRAYQAVKGKRLQPLNVELNPVGKTVSFDSAGNVRVIDKQDVANIIKSADDINAKGRTLEQAKKEYAKEGLLKKYGYVEGQEVEVLDRRTGQWEKDTVRAGHIDTFGRDTIITKRGYLQRPEEIRPIKETPKPEAPAKPVVESGIVELGAGVSPAAAIRQMDRLDIPPREGGSFRVERPVKPGRDFAVQDLVLQPRGIYTAEGKPIQKGTYDRLGKVVREDGTVDAVGSKIGFQMSKTFQDIDARTFEAEKQIENIGHLIDSTVKGKLGRRSRSQKAFEDFVDLVEKPFDDAERAAIKNSDTPTGKALKLHDELTEQFRQYIIDTRRGLGMDMPDDWGITKQGYFRHLFLGDIRLLKDGAIVDTARTYAEAQKKALDILKKEPNANIVARARNIVSGDPTVRLSTRKFFQAVSNIAEETTLTKTEIMEDLRGIVGRKSSKQKWFGALLPRKGVKGYSKAYMDVMRIHAAQVFRTQELTKMQRKIQPMIEDLQANGLPGLAEQVENQVGRLWGTPTSLERQFGEMIRSMPVLRNHVANPEFALRSVAARLTGLQTWMKIKASPRSALVNAMQPFSTLWPYISTKDFAALYADALKPSTRRMLREKGVLQGATKLEKSGIMAVGRQPSSLAPWNLFSKASETNRAVGYLYGYRKALKRGLSEKAADFEGRSWAEKVEFDNSARNIQPLLSSPGGRTLGQFKSFMFKNLENVRDVFAPEGLPRGQRVGRAAKWSAAQLGVGGVKSLGVITKAAGGYKLVEFISKELQEEFGWKKEDADKVAEAVYYGAPALLGQDLSGSVMILEPPYGRTPKEQLVNAVFGPTVDSGLSVSIAAYDAWQAWKSGDYKKALEKAERAAKSASPAFKTYNTLKQARESKDWTTQVKTGNKQYVTLTPFESVMYALAFTPLKQTKTYDKRDAGIKKPKPTPKQSGGLNFAPKAFAPKKFTP